jgi:hypothetical protein
VIQDKKLRKSGYKLSREDNKVSSYAQQKKVAVIGYISFTGGGVGDVSLAEMHSE